MEQSINHAESNSERFSNKTDKIKRALLVKITETVFGFLPQATVRKCTRHVIYRIILREKNILSFVRFIADFASCLKYLTSVKA